MQIYYIAIDNGYQYQLRAKNVRVFAEIDDTDEDNVDLSYLTSLWIKL